MPSGGGEGVGQRPSSLSEEPGGLDALHLAGQVASRNAVVEETVLFVGRSRVGGSRPTLMPFFSGHLVEVLGFVWWMRVYYGVGGWVGQVYIISLAPHPGGQQQKMPFTTKVRRTSVPARSFLCPC